MNTFKCSEQNGKVFFSRFRTDLEPALEKSTITPETK